MVIREVNNLTLQATNQSIYLVQKSLSHGFVNTPELYKRKQVNFTLESPLLKYITYYRTTWFRVTLSHYND